MTRDSPPTLRHDPLIDEGIEDDAVESDLEQEVPGIERYEIGFYGTDFPVDAIYKRISSADDETEGDIFIPNFQRGFVWTKKQADRFIESLLLGLPVPGIFLSTDRSTNKRFVIDGGQRLRTIKAFMDGDFKGSEFKLGKGVHQDFEGKRYSDLSPSDRRRFDDAIIHATIVRQDEPKDGNRSLFYLFERLNTGGTPAAAHEVRRNLWGGALNNMIKNLATNQSWRNVYGPPSRRLKDEELILRFLALSVDESRYGSTGERTMKDFLSSFMARHRDTSGPQAAKWRSSFQEVIELIDNVFGRDAFRPEGRLNTAVFDAVMVGLAHVRETGRLPQPNPLRRSYVRLLQDDEFIAATSSRTSHQPNVRKRLQLGREAFVDSLHP